MIVIVTVIVIGTARLDAEPSGSPIPLKDSSLDIVAISL